MKVTTVISDGEEDEIIIKCREKTEGIGYLETLIKNASGQSDTLLLTMSDVQYFISSKEVALSGWLSG